MAIKPSKKSFISATDSSGLHVLPEHVIIINGSRAFKTRIPYLWLEGYVTGKGNGWEFDRYKPEDQNLLELSW